MSDFSVVDNETGEVVGGLNYGDTIIAKEELQRRSKEKKKRLEREAYKRNTKEKFFFVKSGTRFPTETLSTATLARLIYLNTFSNYDGVLMVTERTPMRKEHLSNILGLGRTATSVFWNEINPEYITEDKQGNMHTSGIWFLRGRLKRKQFNQYQKFYDSGIRKLYMSVNGRTHKNLGYIFSMLPYVNIEYNLVCHNPYETNIDNVEFMSIAEFCEFIGYSVNHVDRLLKIYDGITFEVNGRLEKFCTITYNGINKRNAKICVNPNVFYIGRNFEAVKIIGAFCRE